MKAPATPIDLWRASFAFWTHAAKTQMDYSMQMFAVMGNWQRVAAGSGPSHPPEMPPNAVSVPKPRRGTPAVPLVALSGAAAKPALPTPR